MNEDKIEGTAKKVLGQAPETFGEVVGDQSLQGKGLLNQAGGIVQDGYGKVRDVVKDIIDDAPATAKVALNTGRDYYQRGSVAATRTMGDNGLIALLAAGVAGAALAWIMFGRRSGSSEE